MFLIVSLSDYIISDFFFARQQASTKKLTNGTSGIASYGSTESPSRFDSGDLDELFPERVHHRSPSVQCF